MIISGSDSAVTAIMNASTVPMRHALAEQHLGDGDDADRVGIQRHADQHRADDRQHAAVAGDAGDEIGRHVAVDEGADARRR